jgi:sirohydrochlorin ferrochelatase
MFSARSALVLAFAAPILGTFAPTAAAAQTAARVGTIIIAHGGDDRWNSQVLDVAKVADTGGPVLVSFLMGPAAKTHRFQDAVDSLARLGAQDIVVVPMLVSSHSGHYDQIRYLTGDTVTLDETMMHHLHMAGIERPRSTVRLHLSAALDSAPQLGRVLAERARTAAGGPLENRAVLLVGHGPNDAVDYARWMAALRPVADSVAARTGAKSVMVELVRDDAPAMVRAEAVTRIRELIGLQRAATNADVVVVPILIADGYASRVKLPKDLAGLPISYQPSGLLPHEAMAEWVESRVRETLRSRVAGARD